MRRERGFTLGEILTTMAIAAIVMAAALPGIRNGLGDQRRAAAVNELVATLQLARSTAITRNLPVSICPSEDGAHCADVGWDRGWIAFVDRGDRQPDGELLAAGDGDPALRIRSDEFARFLRFWPDGQAGSARHDSATGDFLFCDGRGAAAARVLHIGPGGRARLDDQQADGRAPDCADGR